MLIASLLEFSTLFLCEPSILCTSCHFYRVALIWTRFQSPIQNPTFSPNSCRSHNELLLHLILHTLNTDKEILHLKTPSSLFLTNCISKRKCNPVLHVYTENPPLTRLQPVTSDPCMCTAMHGLVFTQLFSVHRGFLLTTSRRH